LSSLPSGEELISLFSSSAKRATVNFPDFEFIVNELPDGGTFNLSFRRPSAAQTSTLRNFMDLESWEFVKEEVELQ
jgi:hypothetical protein